MKRIPSVLATGGRLRPIFFCYILFLIKGKASHVDTAEVDCPCPPLLSVEGGIVLDFSKQQIHVKTLGVEGLKMRMAPSGHPLLPLTDFTKGQ